MYTLYILGLIDLTSFARQNKVVLAILLVISIVVSLLARYWEIKVSAAEYSAVPRFVTAIYLRKLEKTGNVWYQKNIHGLSSVMNSGRLTVIIPFAASMLFIDPIIISFFIYLIAKSPSVDAKVLMSLLSLIFAVPWIYGMARIVIPSIFMKKYWKQR